MSLFGLASRSALVWIPVMEPNMFLISSRWGGTVEGLMVGVPVALLVTVPCVNSIGGSLLIMHCLVNSACSIVLSFIWHAVEVMLNACATGLELPWAVRKGCSRR